MEAYIIVSEEYLYSYIDKNNYSLIKNMDCYHYMAYLFLD